MSSHTLWLLLSLHYHHKFHITLEYFILLLGFRLVKILIYQLSLVVVLTLRDVNIW